LIRLMAKVELLWSIFNTLNINRIKENTKNGIQAINSNIVLLLMFL